MYKNECKHVMIESETNRYIKIWHENPCTWFMHKLYLCSHDTIQRCQVCVHMWTRMPWLWRWLIKSCGTLKLLPLTWWIYVYDFDVLSCAKVQIWLQDRQVSLVNHDVKVIFMTPYPYQMDPLWREYSSTVCCHIYQDLGENQLHLYLKR